MTHGVAFNVSGRPAAWQRTATFNGRRITPKTMRAAQKLIASSCRLAMGSRPPLAGPVRLEILAIYAIPKSWPIYKQLVARAGRIFKSTVPDLDNLGKIVDCLNGIAWEDDAQVAASSMLKRYGFPERTEFRISPLDGLCDHSPTAAIRLVAQELMGQSSLPVLPSNECNTQSNEGR